MVLDNVGIVDGKPVDNYHVLEDWGRDILSMAKSTGAGGIALWKNDRLYRLGTWEGKEDVVDSTVYELISNGPVRSIFQLSYHGWEVEGEKFDVKNIISIWAGKRSYESKIWMRASKVMKRWRLE